MRASCLAIFNASSSLPVVWIRYGGVSNEAEGEKYFIKTVKRLAKLERDSGTCFTDLESLLNVGESVFLHFCLQRYVEG